MLYSIEILDSSLNFKAFARNLAALNTSGTIIEYSQRLSDYGTCRFRLGTKDPLLATEGDILQPYQNHVRIKRAGVVVWQGVIVNNPHRTKNYIEVEARTYLFLLDKVLIKLDTNGPFPNARTFNSGTLANSISTILTEAKASAGLPLTNMTIGTIDNPTFPVGYVDTTGAALSGSWTWSNNFQTQFSFQSILYVIKSLGAYSQFDFEMTNNFVFNFKSYIGNKQSNVAFTYGASNATGQIEDYDALLDGADMVTHLWGVGADNQSNIITTDVTNTTAQGIYGLLEGVAAFADVKDKNTLNTRLQQSLRLNSTPQAEIRVVLNNKAYPLGQYGLGDTTTFNIKDHVISVNQARRIVGIQVNVSNVNNETIELSTNIPRDV